jgi:CubicO group peptidase (beta-lactamase class C family)
MKGWTARGFEEVAEVFESNFRERAEVGAAFAAYVGGEPVVDLWGGVAEAAAGRSWEEDTMSVVFSTTKGVAAASALLLVDRGLLDLDAPVAAYWPEFAQAGKEKIPVRWLFSHRAGLVAVDSPLSLEDVVASGPVVAALASQAPNWEPGEGHGYHMLTYGWLLGELVRRITGKTLGAFFRAEVAEPLGLDFWIGLPEEHEPRVAPLIAPRRSAAAKSRVTQLLFDPATLLSRAMRNPFLSLDALNSAAIHHAEIPAAGGIGTARALARLYAALIGEVSGVRVLSPATLERATGVESEGEDRVLMVDTRFGLGFMHPCALSPLGGPTSFGHPGLGGAVAFADKARGLSVAYTMNAMSALIGTDARSESLVAAVYRAVG